jgi:nucleoside-diphosphate-sugar epimerase
MRILITGSNGIIGQQLLDGLINDSLNHDIFLINRTIPKNHLKLENSKIKYFELDLLKIGKEYIDDLIKLVEPEIFIHLAWNTSHTEYLTTEDNLLWESLTINLINSFYTLGGKKFIGIGTSLEYDWTEISDRKLNELTSNLSGSKWLYGQSKLRIYRYLESLKNIEYLWCRVFFVFGPNQEKSRLLPKILNSYYDPHSPISLNLNLKRDYISTFEIAKQLIMLMKTNYSGPVNICSGNSIELNFFLEVSSKILKMSTNISKKIYKDDFEIKDICGELGVINMLFNNYRYTKEDIELDIKKTINYNQKTNKNEINFKTGFNKGCQNN